MPTITNNYSSINNGPSAQKTSPPTIKTEHSGMLSNRKITPKSTPDKLLCHHECLIKEKEVTQKVLSLFNIKQDFVAVRVQDNQFTDIKNKTIQGHKNTIARVMDWYNPKENACGITMGTPRRSADIAKEESRNALNFMLMEKNIFHEKILNNDNSFQKSYSITENSSWVTVSVGALLDKGAKVYPDISSSLRLGEPFIITLPESVRLEVDIYPLKKSS